MGCLRQSKQLLYRLLLYTQLNHCFQVSVLFLTPWVAVLILRLKLVPQELITGNYASFYFEKVLLKRLQGSANSFCIDAVGLALFCCVPTTLSSGVALTQVSAAL